MENITLHMIDNFEIHLGLLIANVAVAAINSIDGCEIDTHEFIEDNYDLIKEVSDDYLPLLFEDLDIDI